MYCKHSPSVRCFLIDQIHKMEHYCTEQKSSGNAFGEAAEPYNGVPAITHTAKEPDTHVMHGHHNNTSHNANPGNTAAVPKLVDDASPRNTYL